MDHSLSLLTKNQPSRTFLDRQHFESPLRWRRRHRKRAAWRRLMKQSR